MEKMSINEMRELRNLPHRPYPSVTSYEMIIIIPSGRRHESGAAIMYVIGCDEEGNPKEIAARCDVIEWECLNDVDFRHIKQDMYFPCGATRFFSRFYKIEVGLSSSTTTIKLIPKK